MKCNECGKRYYSKGNCGECYEEIAELWNYVVFNHPLIFKKFQKSTDKDTKAREKK